jgi:dihydrofolate synthase / folylpolyglutamate synthase
MELGLERVRVVAQRMDLKPANFTAISVAGTNGKGSTVAMLEAMLHASGYKVGAYSSPHMHRYNERVRIGLQMATDEQLCAAFERIEHTRRETPLTYFEFGTLAALQLFCDEHVDVAVLEVGLGGRLDAVNIIDADTSIVTSIGTDHTYWLSDDREVIGQEKAGIFRSNGSAICADPDPPASVERTAKALKARFFQLARDFHIELGDGSWCWRSSRQIRAGLPYPAMRGEYQLRNAAAALMALETVAQQLPVTQAQVRSGLLAAVLPGRFQTLAGLPLRVLDVAHNAEAAAALAATLAARNVSGQTHAVLGILRDKPIARIVSTMSPVVEHWHVATLAVPRGSTGEELLAVLRGAGIGAPATAYPDPVHAYQGACARASAQDRIVVFGSFYTVSDILRFLM